MESSYSTSNNYFAAWVFIHNEDSLWLVVAADILRGLFIGLGLGYAITFSLAGVVANTVYFDYDPPQVDVRQTDLSWLPSYMAPSFSTSLVALLLLSTILLAWLSTELYWSVWGVCVVFVRFLLFTRSTVRPVEALTSPLLALTLPILVYVSHTCWILVFS